MLSGSDARRSGIRSIAMSLHGVYRRSSAQRKRWPFSHPLNLSFSPEEPPPSSQPFAMHAPLSAIYSAMFNQSTVAEDGEITELRIDIDPGALGALVPDDYEGETLRI